MKDTLHLFKDDYDFIVLCELISWETNQYIADYLKCDINIIRKYRKEFKKHNRHGVDDEELGNQQW